MGAKILQTVLLTVLIAFQTLFAAGTRDGEPSRPAVAFAPR